MTLVRRPSPIGEPVSLRQTNGSNGSKGTRGLATGEATLEPARTGA